MSGQATNCLQGDNEMSINKAVAATTGGGSVYRSNGVTSPPATAFSHPEDTVPEFADPLHEYYSQDHSYWPLY